MQKFAGIAKNTLLHVAVPFLFVLASPALAADWTVTKVSGLAWVRTSNAPQMPVTLGMSIPASASIGTSASGRVMLERGTGRIFVSPGTSIVVHDTGQNATQVLQTRGTIELEVEKRSAPYFSVETPLLAALVKGTHFTTTVKNGRSTVHVDHGVVQVRELASGKTVDLTMGQSAGSVQGARNGFSVAGVGQLPGITLGTPRTPQVSSPAAASTPAATAKSYGDTTSASNAGSVASGGASTATSAGAAKGGGSGPAAGSASANPGTSSSAGGTATAGSNPPTSASSGNSAAPTTLGNSSSSNSGTTVTTLTPPIPSKTGTEGSPSTGSSGSSSNSASTDTPGKGGTAGSNGNSGTSTTSTTSPGKGSTAGSNGHSGTIGTIGTTSTASPGKSGTEGSGGNSGTTSHGRGATAGSNGDSGKKP